MKKAAHLFVVLILMALTSRAQAQNMTRFERLQRAFHTAHQRADISDFDANSWDHCTYTDVSNPQLARPTHVRTLQLIVPPGNDQSQARTEYRVDLFSDPVVDQNIVSFFNSSFEVLNANYFLQVLDGPNWSRMDIYGKKDGDALLFELAASQYRGANAPMYAKGYGYCWNESSEPADQNAEPRSEANSDASSLPPAPGQRFPPPTPRTRVSPPDSQQVPPPPSSQVPPPATAAKPKVAPVPKKSVPAKQTSDDTTPMPLPPPPGA